METQNFSVITGNIEKICDVNETFNIFEFNVIVHTDKKMINIEQTVSNYIDNVFVTLNKKPDFIVVKKSNIYIGLVFEIVI